MKKDFLKNTWVLINTIEEFEEFISKYNCIFGDKFATVYSDFYKKTHYWNTFPVVVKYFDKTHSTKLTVSFQPITSNIDKKYKDNIPSKIWKNPEDFPEYLL